MMSIYFSLIVEKLIDGNAKKIHFFVLKDKKGELWCQIFIYLFLDLIYFSFQKMNKIKLLNTMVF